MRINEVHDLPTHHAHLTAALALLKRRTPDWSDDDRTRGEATKMNLQRQISEIEKGARK